MEIKVLNEKNELSADVSYLLSEFESNIKTLEAKREQIVSAIKLAMEENGIKKFENEFISITYVAECIKDKFNTSKFKMEQQDLYEEYVEPSFTKASVRIKVKGEKNENPTT